MRFNTQGFAFAFSVLFSHVAVAAPLSKPLVPLVFRANINGPVNYSNSELDKIASQGDGLTALDGALPTGSDLSYLRSKDRNLTITAYLNAGHQGSWPDTGEQIEDDRLNYIQVYRATALRANISKTTTQIPVASSSDIPVTGGAVNPRTAVYSLDGRTGANGGFISFIRIGKEIMRVTGKTSNPAKLTVIRGTDGTSPATHDADEPVLAPVYVQDSNPDGPQAIEDGWVRYSLNVGTPELAEFLASFVEGDIRAGWDGAWLDITSPNFNNMVDAKNNEIDGETRFPYNTVAGEDYTLDARAHHHDLKIGRIQTEIQATLGRLPVLAANNNANGKWFDDMGYARRFAEDNDAKVQPADGVSLEAPFTGPESNAPYYSYRGLSTWKKNVRTIADATNRGLAVLTWLKMTDGSDLVPDSLTNIIGYGWASMLLAWGPLPGDSRAVLELWTKSGGDRVIKLPDFLYYPLGEPVGDGPATDSDLERLLVGSSTYKRDWSRGTILVNPDETSDNQLSVRGYVDPATCRSVTVTSMPAHSYKILLESGACN